MPDKNEIERRKQIARELRFKARLEFDTGMPMSRENFKALFDNLNEKLTENDCDHSLKFSIRFLETLNLDSMEETAKWLKENGGYCDCEVLSNVEEKFDDNAIL